jgi:hypothetical protein
MNKKREYYCSSFNFHRIISSSSDTGIFTLAVGQNFCFVSNGHSQIGVEKKGFNSESVLLVNQRSKGFGVFVPRDNPSIRKNQGRQA